MNPTAAARSQSEITNAQIQERGKQLGLVLVRMAPSWRWFIKKDDGTKVNLATTNQLAWEALALMKPTKPRKKKPLLVWAGSGQGVLKDRDPLLQGDPADVRVFACAVSRAALIRMIHEYRGYETPSIEYRIKAHWGTSWEGPMERAEHKPGIWIQYLADERPLRVK